MNSRTSAIKSCLHTFSKSYWKCAAGPFGVDWCCTHRSPQTEKESALALGGRRFHTRHSTLHAVRPGSKDSKTMDDVSQGVHAHSKHSKRSTQHSSTGHVKRKRKTRDDPFIPTAALHAEKSPIDRVLMESSNPVIPPSLANQVVNNYPEKAINHLKQAHLENKMSPSNAIPSPFIDPTMESTMTSVSLDDILRARQVQLTLLKNTPLQKSSHLSEMIPGNNQVYLKFESAHLTGSFKERGAIYKLASLSPEEKQKGVVAASAGNHAQAVSYHASRLGIRATIVMPELTPLAKVEGTRKYGAEVVLHGDSLYASLQKASEICEKENRVFVHPYNDDKIIAGQGTLGIELMEQNPFLDAVVVSIGGGGLAAGMAIALKQVNPRIKIYGVESQNMPGMKTSLGGKKVVDVPFVRTLADGIAVKSVGDKTLSIIKDYVDDIVTVSENEIASAVMTLLEKEKTMTEGAGACSVAALLSDKLKLQNKRVCCILTGGNIDLSVLREIIDRGLVSSGRLARVRITVPDTTGHLARVLTLLATLGCNVSEVVHERAFLNLVGSVSVLVTIQTRGNEHIEKIAESLKQHGYHHKFISQFDDSDLDG